jgi:hypothetical protein
MNLRIKRARRDALNTEARSVRPDATFKLDNKHVIRTGSG